MTSPDGAAFRKGRGRPTKLTPDLVDRICKIIRAGNYRDTAAAVAGLSRQTFLDFQKRGGRYREGFGPDGTGKRRKQDKVYADFLDALEQAEAQGEVGDVLIVGKSARGVAVQGTDGEVYVQPPNWRAAAWRLERRNSERWGRRERVDVGGVEGAPAIVIKMWQPERAQRRGAGEATGP